MEENLEDSEIIQEPIEPEYLEPLGGDTLPPRADQEETKPKEVNVLPPKPTGGNKKRKTLKGKPNVAKQCEERSEAIRIVQNWIGNGKENGKLPEQKKYDYTRKELSTIKEETSTDMLVSKEDLVWDDYDENHKNGKVRVKTLKRETPQATPRDKTYGSLKKNGKTGMFSDGETPRRNIVYGTKSLPSPKKLSFDINGETNQPILKKSTKTAVNGIKEDSSQRHPQDTPTQEELEYMYKNRNCISLPQEHPDAYGGGPLKEFGGNPTRKYKTLQRAKGLYRVADVGIYGNDWDDVIRKDVTHEGWYKFMEIRCDLCNGDHLYNFCPIYDEERQLKPSYNDPDFSVILLWQIIWQVIVIFVVAYTIERIVPLTN